MHSHAEGDDLLDHLRDVPWEHITKLGASAAASEFCEWVQAGIQTDLLGGIYPSSRYILLMSVFERRLSF